MEFKLGKETRNIKTSKNTPIVRKNLEGNIKGEAYMDGTIAIDKSVPVGSPKWEKIKTHEEDHSKRMQSGELKYGDDSIEWRGKQYDRKDGYIKHKGRWFVEGHKKLPWEKIAHKSSKS